MFSKESLIGKKIGDVITENTKILTEFKEDYNVKEAVFKKGNIRIQSADNMTVIIDYQNHLVLCAKGDKIVALFHVYDIYDVSLNSKRKMVTAVGHETSHQYWFEDEGYECQYTR